MDKGVVEAGQRTVLGILLAASFSHMVNDTLQSLLPAIYPMIAGEFALDFTRIGLLTLTYQMTGSILQPLVGLVADKRPQPFALPVAMAATSAGLTLLSLAGSYSTLLAGAALMGVGSSIFHPEASRVARMASGGRHGLAQSLFQVGGNLGTSLGPLVAAFLVLPGGRGSIRWAVLVAVVGMVVLVRVGLWYRSHHQAAAKRPRPVTTTHLDRRQTAKALAILMVLMFSKFFYTASLGNYYTFFLIHRFGVSVDQAQVYLFVFLAAVAVGTISGGPLSDRFGRKRVIWVSILGVLPFTLVLPYVGLAWTGILTVPIGLILASAFPSIVVYAQELLPGRVGAVAGTFFGLAFGLAGIGAAVLGRFADYAGIEAVYRVCAFLPLFGLLTVYLPEMEPPRSGRPMAAENAAENLPV